MIDLYEETVADLWELLIWMDEIFDDDELPEMFFVLADKYEYQHNHERVSTEEGEETESAL